MTKRSFATLGTLALLAAASAFGQQRIRVDIPFEFHLAGTVLPAGQYEVNVGAHNMQSLVSSIALSAEPARMPQRLESAAAPTRSPRPVGV